MSIFAQPVPYGFRQGNWDSRRQEVAQVALESIGRFSSNIPQAVLHLEVMGPPDIERVPADPDADDGQSKKERRTQTAESGV
jgi:phytoene dehydrogenase-like protein